MRGIDVAAMMRDETCYGDPIEFVGRTAMPMSPCRNSTLQ